jgi:HAE1 family hydrophobic/amphiphilic exporter-1
MLFCALLVLGFKAKWGMPVDLYPRVDVPNVVVTTIYPGAGPEEVESQVTKSIEDSVSSVNGVKNVNSFSQEGISVVDIELQLGTNMDSAMSDVRAKVDTAKMLLPPEAKNPIIQKYDIGSMPILYVGVSSKQSSREMRTLADEVIKNRLGKVPGVAAVTVTGGDVREIQVNVDKNRLQAYGLSIGQIQQAMAMQNLNLPSGQVGEGRREYAIRAIGEFSSPDEIRRLRVKFPGPDGDRVLTIGDIAEVKDTIADRTEAARLQGKESITLMIQKQSDANTVNVADAVKKELKAMTDVLPKDTQIAVAVDQSKTVKEAAADVNTSLWLGAFLAVLVVYLFLHNMRGTFIVAIAIPTSIVATFIPIFFAGFTMNMMVMLALSLSVGILVDDSIVVLENIYRHLAKGESPAEAAMNGRSEIGLAAITITMVDVVVFLPIAFMGGIVGRFFREFGITVATATLFSLFVSFTLTPMLASRWYKRGEVLEATSGFFARFDRFYHDLDRIYRSILRWALRHRWAVVVTGIVAMLLSVLVVYLTVDTEFSPKFDQGQADVVVELPAGSALSATDAVVKRVEKAVSTIPDIQYVSSAIGRTQGNDGSGEEGTNYGQVTVSMYEKESVLDSLLRPFYRGAHKRIRKDEDVAKEIREKVADIPDGNIKVHLSGGIGPGNDPIEIELLGDDPAELNSVAQKIKTAVASTEGVINADLSSKMGKPEIRARIDRDKAADLGLDVATIASALRTSIAGSTDTRYRERGREYDIRVRLKEFDRNSVQDVSHIVIGSAYNRPVYLQDVAEIYSDTGPTKIERENRQRKVTLTADLAEGYHIGNLQKILDAKLKNIDMGNVHMQWGGEAGDMVESAENMGFALVLSIALVYMLMAALFESLFNPLVIICSVPMAMVGALIGLSATGSTMSMISAIGIIMLIGLVTKNAILLVDYTNRLREQGMDRESAILQAGPTRLRPILMTTFAMIFGMLPTAMKLGRGSELRAPMAVAVIGGLIVSTVLTLVMIPTIYTLMDDFVQKRLRRKGAGKASSPRSRMGESLGEERELTGRK